MGTVRCTIDTLPQITEEEMAEIKTLSERPDSEIDFYDIPELTEEDMARMKPARLKVGLYGHETSFV